MAYGRLEPTDADTLVFVNSVIPLVFTLTLEITLIESSPKIYKKLLAETICWMFPCKVSSVKTKLPADTLVKSV